MKRIVVLGSAGSIGVNTLRVVSALPKEFTVVGLAVNRNYEAVLEQAREFGVRHIAVSEPSAARACRASAPDSVEILDGDAGVAALAGLPDVDIVVCAVVGLAGLRPVLAAVNNGTDVALATKEVLVAAGESVTAACRRTGARILPIDSEHSAIFQCLGATPLTGDPASLARVRRLVLTASGGPFADRPDLDWSTVTVEQALNHPRWRMGPKVTVDSATLMNKGLEIMEAHWLFGIDLSRIDVLVHPESIVHSLVEYVDGSMLAQLSPPDMRMAIQYALTYPDRLDGGLPASDLASIGELHFRRAESGRFPCLRLAREASEAGGTVPAVLNAANEVAVSRFLDGELNFPGIWRTVEGVLARHDAESEPTLDGILDADTWARRTAMSFGGV